MGRRMYYILKIIYENEEIIAKKNINIIKRI